MGFKNPAPSTRLRRDGGAFLDGDVTLLGGVGMSFRDSDLDPKGIVLDAPAVDKDAPAGLYIPDLATWPATTLKLPSSPSYLTLLEALIAGNAPAAGTDTNNCRAVRARGSSSGQQDVKLQTVGGRAFYWSGADLTVLGAQTNQDAAQTQKGFLQRVLPTADMTVTAVGFAHRGVFAIAGLNRVVEVLNGDRSEVLASSAVFSNEPPGDVITSYPLLNSVDFVQGQTYWVGCRIMNAGTRLMQIWGGNIGRSYSGSVSDPGALGNHGMVLGQNDDSGTWLSSGGAYADTGYYGLRFQLSGSPGGVLINGDLILENATFGAPPNVPTGINVRLQWASEI